MKDGIQKEDLVDCGSSDLYKSGQLDDKTLQILKEAYGV